jgi:geranylgeranyl pyrophosphate synthase
MGTDVMNATTELEVPQKVPMLKSREPEKKVPATRQERETILRLVRHYVANIDLAPPIPTQDLQKHSEFVLSENKIDPVYAEYTGVLINNELWKEQLSGIPFNKRLLLLPKCLRVEERCPAPFDEFGLLCKQCGLCSIQDLEADAQRLGYAVLVAEGSAVVMKLIESGQIEAIVGVSCLSVLKKTFPYMEMAAIPGIAIPLLQGDCKETNVDIEWLWESIHLTSDDKSARLDLDGIREKVDSWFTKTSLIEIMGPCEDPTEAIAREWLGRDGKRWRPFLTSAVLEALGQDTDVLDLKKCAVAVECFHKASLIHDDIEDEDEYRYGEKTLHEQYGVAVAINVGDLLIGEGYRLIADTDLDAEKVKAMTLLASQGHKTLSQGQGKELLWRQKPGFIPQLDLLAMFKQKTAPAFDVALRMGALYADVDKDSLEVLKQFSDHLGIAYQIKDDLEDAIEGAEGADLLPSRPSLVLSLAYEHANASQRAMIEKWWAGDEAVTRKDLDQIISELEIYEKMEDLKESFKQGAIDALLGIKDPSLKGLLRRVTSKLFNDLVIQGWCNEVEEESP